MEKVILNRRIKADVARVAIGTLIVFSISATFTWHLSRHWGLDKDASQYFTF